MMTSRLMTTTVSQRGTTSIDANTTNADRINILSASGSMYAPSVVLELVSRAIAPSRESVMPARTKTTRAAPTRPSVRNMRKIGIATMRRIVRKFGRLSTVSPRSSDSPNPHARRTNCWRSPSWCRRSGPRGDQRGLLARRGRPRQRLEFAVFVEVADDVAPADKLAVDVDLRDRRPVGEVLYAFANLWVLKHVDSLVRYGELVQ